MTSRQKKELSKIIAGFFIYLLLILGEHSGRFDLIFENRLYALLLFLVPYLICGYDVLKGCIRGILNRQLFDESFLMTIATFGAFATAQFSEAVAVMIFYQVGEFFQSYAVGRSRRSISDLMDIAPEFANREVAEGSFETIDPDEVEIGDILVIRPGEKIPVDGTVISGTSLVNTSALTGESVPANVTEGDLVISGCINGDGLLRIRADKAYDDSTVAKVLELVENASEKKSQTENFITRFARVYTPIVVFAAIALALIPPIFVGDFSTWIYRACSFLVISCPCALVISVPMAFFGGIGAASAAGVLVKGSNYLELMAGIDTLVTDKTGTLTKGNFKVTKLIPQGDASPFELLTLAAAAESYSTHPIAVSIREACLLETGVLPPSPDSISNISGRGIVADMDGKEVLVGSELLLKDRSIDVIAPEDEASTVTYVARDGICLGVILIRDEVKPEAREAISEIKTLGVSQVIMLTGDRDAVGQAVARELGLNKALTELLPQDKVLRVEELMAEAKGRTLCFIGDGINDAPVLRRADVGIAMGSLGSDAAIEAADVVIMDDNIKRIPRVIRIARRTVRISRQNIAFALAVKAGILILAGLGIANMWAAVFADVGVAVLCILNSMRLLRQKH